MRFSVSCPLPIFFCAIPIHQFGVFTSRSPRGLPWSLNITWIGRVLHERPPARRHVVPRVRILRERLARNHEP